MNEGYGKGYRFIGEFAMYPLDFTEQEAMLFCMIPALVDTTKLPAEFDSAFDKVISAHTKLKQGIVKLWKILQGLYGWGYPLTVKREKIQTC